MEDNKQEQGTKTEKDKKPDIQNTITKKKSNPKENEDIPAKVALKKINFEGVLYEIQNTVLVRETEDTNMIVKIEEIIKENGDPKHPKWPMINVTW